MWEQEVRQAGNLIGHAIPYFLCLLDCYISLRIFLIPRSFRILAMQAIDFWITLIIYTWMSLVYVFNPRLQGCKIPFAREQLRCLPMCTGGTSHATCLEDLPVPSLSTPGFAHLIWLRPGNKLNYSYDGQQQRRGARLDLHRPSCTGPTIFLLPLELLRVMILKAALGSWVTWIGFCP